MKKVLKLHKSSKKEKDSTIVESGDIGDLSYIIYKRGTIHILQGNDLVFKKDIYQFEEDLSRINFEEILNKDTVTIPGSGDNDNLIFFKEDREVKIRIEKKKLPIIQKLLDIIKKGKENPT